MRRNIFLIFPKIYNKYSIIKRVNISKQGGYLLQFYKGNMEVDGVAVPFTLSEKEHQSKKLAILLPGNEYTSQAPLIWYTNQLYLDQGFDTLQFHYSLQNLDEEKLPMIVNKMILAFLQERKYENLHFVSMGLGSTVAAHFFTHQVYPESKAVWFSPYTFHPNVLQALLNRSNKGLVFLGEIGDFIQEEGAHLIEEKEHLLVAHVAGGNDVLETPWAEINISTMKSLMQMIKQFIESEEIELIKEKTKIRVYFSLYGDDFPLEEVTEKLGLLPTSTDKKGEEIIPPNGKIIPHARRYYPETRWELDTDYEESKDLEIQMDKLIGKLRSKTFIINELRGKYNLRSHIQVVVELENGETPALTLNKKVISFAHQIQSEFIDIDMYVMPFDDNLRFESDGVNFKGRKLK